MEKQERFEIVKSIAEGEFANWADVKPLIGKEIEIEIDPSTMHWLNKRLYSFFVNKESILYVKYPTINHLGFLFQRATQRLLSTGVNSRTSCGNKFVFYPQIANLFMLLAAKTSRS